MLTTHQITGATAIAERLLDLEVVIAVEMALIPGSDRPDFFGPRYRIIAVIDDEGYHRYLEELSRSDLSASEVVLRALGITTPHLDTRTFMELAVFDKLLLNPAGINQVLDSFELVPLRRHWRRDVDTLDASISHPFIDIAERCHILGLTSPWRFAAENYKVYVPVLESFVSPKR